MTFLALVRKESKRPLKYFNLVFQYLKRQDWHLLGSPESLGWKA